MFLLKFKLKEKILEILFKWQKEKIITQTPKSMFTALLFEIYLFITITYPQSIKKSGHWSINSAISIKKMCSEFLFVRQKDTLVKKIYRMAPSCT